MTFAALLFLIAVFVACIVGIARAGTAKDLARIALWRDATPPHTYTRDDGTKGNWP